MKTSVALFLIVAVTFRQSIAGENAEVNRVMGDYSKWLRSTEAHKAEFTGDDIAALGEIKTKILDLIDRGILVASGQTYPGNAGMHLEFYRIQSDSPSEKTMVSLPATTKITARELSGAPSNWAYDDLGKKYFHLRDEGKPVAQVYFPAIEEIHAVNRWKLGRSVTNDEVTRLLQKFSLVTRLVDVHAPELTDDDIYAFEGIKIEVFSLIDQGILVASGQTYSCNAEMDMEFYSAYSLSPSTKEWVVLPATTPEVSGAPTNWAYDEFGKKYFKLRDGDEPVAKVYFPE